MVDRSNQNLGQRLGEKAFELSLRNRYKDELHDSSYIYQIRDKFSTNRVIAKLRSKNVIKTRLPAIIKGKTIADSKGKESTTHSMINMM